MPIFCYECPACKHVFDAWNTINKRLEANCPECGTKCKNLITSFNTKIFKPYVEQNLGDKSVLIKSIQHLKDEIKRVEDRTMGKEKLFFKEGD